MSPAVALDREVFVEGADERLIRIEDHPIVGHLGNRPSGGNRQHARPAAATHRAVHFVAVNHRGAASPPARDPFRRHRHHGIEVQPLERAIRPGAPDQHRTGRPPCIRDTRSRRQSAAKGRRAARRARRCDRARRSGSTAPEPRTRSNRRATSGTRALSACRKSCDPSGRRAGATSQSVAASRSDIRDRRRRCRCRARARQSRPAPSACRP